MISKLLNKLHKVIALNKEEEVFFSSHWTEKTFEKNDYLLRNGQVCRTDNFLIEGAMKAYYINPENGKEEILYLAIEEWWATDIQSFRNQTPSIYNIQAIEKTKVLQITKESFQIILDEIPKLERFFRIILESYLGALQRKIIINQVYDAEQRYLDFLEQYPEISERFPNYLIASYLNLSPEFLSRIRNK